MEDVKKNKSLWQSKSAEDSKYPIEESSDFQKKQANIDL
jgi:hypothetical protein